MKTCFKSVLYLMAATILLMGCSTPRQNTFLMDMAYNTAYPAPPAPELLLRSGDVLNIQVLSQPKELAAPFHIGADENNAAADVYTIDRDGEIDFPVLGLLHVEGLTLKQTERLIAGEISNRGFIRQPTVRVTLDNFAVTVIGQSGNTVLPVKGNSINLLEAIASTGGIKPNSNIREVTVIRTQDGVRRSYKVNLQSQELFASPVYYLQQNDIVYVKPKGASLSSGGQTALSFSGVILSLGSIVTNIILWTSRR